MKRTMVLTAVLLAMLIAVPSAFAAGDKGDDGWKFDLAPFYLWAVTIDGDVGMGPVDQSLEADFGEIWDNLETVVTAHFEARKGCWGGIIDLSTMKLSPEKALNGVTVGVDLKNSMVEIDGFYSIAKEAHTFDIIAGLRWTEQETDISITPPGLTGGIKADWWDPIVGARWMWGFTPKWQLTARGDIGGFGVGSDFTWNASALVIWQPWKHVALAAGYRALYQDYEDGEGRDRYKWDATMSGPIAGVDFRW